MSTLNEEVNKFSTAIFIGHHNGHDVAFYTPNIDIREFYCALQQAFKNRRFRSQLVCALAYAFANDEVLANDVNYLAKNIYNNEKNR